MRPELCESAGSDRAGHPAGARAPVPVPTRRAERAVQADCHPHADAARSAAGLVCESGTSQGQRGPGAQLYGVNPAAGCAVGVDVTPSLVRASVADVTGRVLTTHTAEDPAAPRRRCRRAGQGARRGSPRRRRRRRRGGAQGHGRRPRGVRHADRCAALRHPSARLAVAHPRVRPGGGLALAARLRQRRQPGRHGGAAGRGGQRPDRLLPAVERGGHRGRDDAGRPYAPGRVRRGGRGRPDAGARHCAGTAGQAGRHRRRPATDLLSGGVAAGGRTRHRRPGRAG